MYLYFTFKSKHCCTFFTPEYSGKPAIRATGGKRKQVDGIEQDSKYILEDNIHCYLSVLNLHVHFVLYRATEEEAVK